MKLIDAIKLIPTCDNFRLNFVIYSILTVISTILSYLIPKDSYNTSAYMIIIVTLILAILTCGYYLVTLRNYMLCKPCFLPDWFNKHDAKQIVIGAIKYIAALFCCLIVIFLWNILGSLFLKTQQYKNATIIALFMSNLCFITAAILVLPAATIEFCTNLKFRSFFNIRQIINIINISGWDYYIAVGIILLLNVVVTVLYNLFANILILNIILTVISVYISLIAAIFYGDVFRKVVNVHKNSGETCS